MDAYPVWPLRPKQCSGCNVVERSWPSLLTCFFAFTHHLCAQNGHFLFNFAPAPVLSFHWILVFRVRFAKTKKVLSKVPITMCWTLKRHVQIAIRVELNFKENKPCRRSNTTCPLLRGNCVNMSREERLFPQSFCGGHSGTPNTFLYLWIPQIIKGVCKFPVIYLHLLHLGRSHKSCLLHPLKGKQQRLA